METTKPPAHDAVTPAAIAASHASASTSEAIRSCGTATTVDGVAVMPMALTPEQVAILEGRGINVELASRMGWRSSGRNVSGNEIEIPYFRKGAEVNCKTRTLSGEKRFFQREGADKCLYNLDVIASLGDNPLVITEGEMDCIIALQCGYVAVSVPDGAPKEAIGDRDSVKYGYLKDIPQSVKRIILATDGDNPGMNLMHDLAIRLGKHRCQWVKYPQGCKDLNDAFLRYGARGVTETLSRAQFFHIDGLHRMEELPPLAVQPALSIGIPALDKHLKLRLGDFSVVTGIPSHGKSTFANSIAHNMAKIHGWNVCFASFEQPPQTEHKRALRTLHAGRQAHLLTEDERQKADAFIQEKFCFIVPNDDSNEWADMTWLKDRMVAAVTRFDTKLIIIDPWNELDHMYNQRETSMTQYVGTAIKDLKRFAKVYQVHVMVVAHPAKMAKDKDGVYPIPRAYDISDSAHWYNKPEQVIVVHRKENGNTLLRIAKSRYHYALGVPGDVELKFDDYNGQYRGAGEII